MQSGAIQFPVLLLYPVYDIRVYYPKLLNQKLKLRPEIPYNIVQNKNHALFKVDEQREKLIITIAISKYI